MKKVTFRLDVDSINNAIAEIKDYRKDTIDAINALCAELVKDGVNIAKYRIAAWQAYDSGLLNSSVQGVFDPSTGIGVINVFADNGMGFNYAQIVEFGSGVKGVADPSPERPSWFTYDRKGHGDNGWWYLRDGVWWRTRGQYPRPFMFETFQELLEKARESKGLVKRIEYKVERNEYGPTQDKGDFEFDPIDY